MKENERKKITARTKSRILIIFIVVFFIISIIYMNYIVNPVIVEASEAKIKSIAQKTLSSSVYNVISNRDTYNKLINYEYDNNHQISMLTVNTLEVNSLARQISSMAQSSLDNSTEAGIEVHLGAFSGMPILANIGPILNFKLTPIGTVSISFQSLFQTAGINQTHHKIYVKVDSSVFVILPTASPRIDVSTQVLVAECVIVGEVPTTFLQSSYLDEMLNLVPV